MGDAKVAHSVVDWVDEKAVAMAVGLVVEKAAGKADSMAEHLVASKVANLVVMMGAQLVKK